MRISFSIAGALPSGAKPPIASSVLKLRLKFRARLFPCAAMEIKFVLSATVCQTFLDGFRFGEKLPTHNTCNYVSYEVSDLVYSEMFSTNLLNVFFFFLTN